MIKVLKARFDNFDAFIINGFIIVVSAATDCSGAFTSSVADKTASGIGTTGDDAAIASSGFVVALVVQA